MYQEFDINSAIAPVTSCESVKLSGVSNVAKIFNSTSASTEEFISGAIADAGVVDRNVMFVNTTLNGLNDRLGIAAKVARSVNYAKNHSSIAGCEAFANAEYLDPWKYAIEGKAKEFFKRIWAAICTACRRVIDMIANFIKWLGNAIASIDVKAQVRDQKAYTANQAAYDKAAKAAKVGTRTIKSLKWTVNESTLGKLITKAAAHYVSSVSGDKEEGDVFMAISKEDLNTLDSPDKMSAAFGRIFKFQVATSGSFGQNVKDTAGTAFGKNKAYTEAKVHIENMTKKIDGDRINGIKSVFGKAGDGKVNAHSIVINAVASSEEVTAMSVDQLHALAGKKFEVLTDTWLATNVKNVIASTSKVQRQFAAYTKTIDKIAAKFDSVNKDMNGVSSLSSLAATLSNARIRYNSFYTGVMLELQSAALRFRKSCHIALKQIMAAGGKKPAAAATESLDRNIDDIFSF